MCFTETQGLIPNKQQCQLKKTSPLTERNLKQDQSQGQFPFSIFQTICLSDSMKDQPGVWYERHRLQWS